MIMTYFENKARLFLVLGYGLFWIQSNLWSNLQEWSDVGIHDKLCLPDQNEFIPTNFDLLTRESEVSKVYQHQQGI